MHPCFSYQVHSCLAGPAGTLGSRGLHVFGGSSWHLRVQGITCIQQISHRVNPSCAQAMRKLGLAAPRGSPYAGAPCLDVARAWLDVLQRQLAEQAQRAEQRAAAAAMQMRAHEQQALQHQLLQVR